LTDEWFVFVAMAVQSKYITDVVPVKVTEIKWYEVSEVQ
jgi:hypothetical protein